MNRERHLSSMCEHQNATPQELNCLSGRDPTPVPCDHLRTESSTHKPPSCHTFSDGMGLGGAHSRSEPILPRACTPCCTCSVITDSMDAEGQLLRNYQDPWCKGRHHADNMPEALKSPGSVGCPGELSISKHPVPLLILGPNRAAQPSILGCGSITKASCSKLTL